MNRCDKRRVASDRPYLERQHLGRLLALLRDPRVWSSVMLTPVTRVVYI